MSWEDEVKLTLLLGIAVLTVVAGILMHKVLLTQDRVRELQIEVQRLEDKVYDKRQTTDGITPAAHTTDDYYPADECVL